MQGRKAERLVGPRAGCSVVATGLLGQTYGAEGSVVDEMRVQFGILSTGNRMVAYTVAIAFQDVHDLFLQLDSIGPCWPAFLHKFRLTAALCWQNPRTKPSNLHPLLWP